MVAWLVATAAGQGLQEQAEALMDLDFDLDAVKRKVRPARAAAPAAPAPYAFDDDGVLGQLGYVVPTPPVERLPLAPNSTLRSVEVYLDRAIVTRDREVPLEVGARSVLFEGLPWTLASEGLTARIVGGGARIVGVEVVSASRRIDEDDAALEDTREAAEEKVDALGLVRDRIEALLSQRSYLRTALVPPAATAAQPVAQVQAALGFVADTERKIAKELRDALEEADDLAEALEPLLRKLDDPLATGQPVRVDLEVEAAGPVRVALTYAVPGAGWSPAYNARLDPASGKVDLEMYGVVAQATAEDWTDAAILLSTANPARGGGGATLAPWTLGVGGGAGAYDLEAGTGATTGAPPAPSTGGVEDAAMSAEVQTGSVVVLAIPGRKTIRGDGSPQRLPVSVQRLAAATSLVAVPKVEPVVSRAARVRYDGTLPLLPGPVSTFVGRDFVGAQALGAVIPGEALALGFGTDDRFRVTRQLVERASERVGRRATRYTFRFRTTVLNHGAEAATVSVSDQVPVAPDAGIEVDVTELGGGVRDAVEGRVDWTLSVPAHGEAKVDLAFSVLVPDELAYVATELRSML